MCRFFELSFILLFSLTLLSCNASELGLQSSDNAKFDGISQIKPLGDGSLVLSWEPHQSKGILDVTYDIFYKKLEPEDVPVSETNAAFLDGSVYDNITYSFLSNNNIYDLLINSNPLKTVSENSATLNLNLAIGSTYAFAIRLKIGEEYQEVGSLNQVALVRSNLPAFEGIQFLDLDVDNRLRLNWNVDSSVDAPEVTYSVYKMAASDQEGFLTSWADKELIELAQKSEIKGMTLRAFTLDDNAQPSYLSDPIASVTEGSSFVVKDQLYLDQPFLLQTEIIGTDSSKVVFLVSFLSENLSGFKGIESISQTGDSQVKVGWTKATNDEVSHYNIYSGPSGSTHIKTVLKSKSEVTIDFDSSDDLVWPFLVKASSVAAVEDSNDLALSLSDTSSSSVVINQVVTGPSVSISPASHDFGSVQAVSGAQTKGFIISTTSDLATLGSLSSTNSAFVIQSDECSSSVLTKSTSCNVTVAFGPQSIGSLSSLITVPFKFADSTENQETSFTVQGVGSAGSSNFAGVTGYSNLNSTSVDLSWESESNTQNYLVYSVTGINETLLKTVSSPASSTTLTGLSAETSYTIKVKAQDSSGVIADNDRSLSFTTPLLVVLTNISSRLLSSTPVEVGDVLNLDADNSEDSGSNTSFTCFYDQTVDGSVDTSTSCSSLPGTVGTSSLTSAGQIDWLVGSSANGKSFEIKFTASVGSASDSKIIVIQVISDYSRSNLVFAADFEFADGYQPRLNSNWGNVVNSASGSSFSSEMTLQSFFDQTSTSGYAGTGVSSDPYRLVFDGADDSAYLTGMDDETDFIYMGWIKPSNIASDWTLFTNGSGSSGAGIKLEHKYVDQRPYYVLTVGGAGVFGEYDTQVLADSPLGYWRFNTSTTGDAVPNLGNSVNSTDGTNSGSTVQQAGLAQDSDSDKAFRISSGDYVSIPQSTEYITTLTQRTVETWFNTDSVEGVAHIAGYGFDSHTSYYGMRILIEHGNVFCLIKEHYGGTTTAGMNYIGSPIVPGIDYHVVAVYDESGGTFKCFVNGVLIASEDAKMASADTASHDDMRFSVGYPLGDMSPLSERYPKSKVYPFTGVIDDTSLYVTALSESRAKAHYLPANGGACGALNPLNADEWAHIAVGYKSNVGSLYINGVKKCQFETPSNGLTGGSSTLQVGSNPDLSNLYSGSLGLMTFYNASSDLDTEVLAHYNATKTDYEIDFMHTLIPRMVTWLDATDMDGDGLTNDQPANASVVAEWKDKTNYANDVDSIYGTPTFNTGLTSASVEGVTFSADDTSADDDYMNLTQSGGSAVGPLQTAIVVARFTSDQGSWHGLMNWVSFHYNQGMRVFQLVAENNVFRALYRITDLSETYSGNTSNPASIFILRRDGASFHQEIDGIIKTGVEASTLTDYGQSAHVGIGYFMWGTGAQFTTYSDSFMDGDIFEIQLYNDYLSDAEVSTLRTQMQSKWQ